MIQISPDKEALSRAAAELITTQACQTIAHHDRFSLVLSGGSTPKRAYELLAEHRLSERIPWHRVHIFWGDERCVPFEDARSNQQMAVQALLGHVPIPKQNIHAIDGSKQPAEAAAAYQAELEAYFNGAAPVFDLVLLGLGDNGHTASLFPGTTVLKEETKWVAEVYVAEVEMWRITLTPVLLNQAALTVFLVAGADKTKVIDEVRTGPWEPDRLPAQLIRPKNGQVIWLLDNDAAGQAKGS